MIGSLEGFDCDQHSESSATLRLDPRVYSREALLRACYWYTNVAYVQASEPADDRFVIQVTLKHPTPTLENPKPISIEDFVGEFCNSLVDFELRRQIEAETASVRQLIIAKAFSESGVLEDDPPGAISDPVEKEKPGSLLRVLNLKDPATE